jgi:hypothetical protein
MSERRKSKRNLHPADMPTQRRAAEELRKLGYTSPEITLDLVVQTAFELHKLNPNEVTIIGDILAVRGQQAIELLSIWALQLENEKRTGTAAKSAEETLSRWQAEREEYNINQAKSQREQLEARQRPGWESIPYTQPIPFAQAAKIVFPKKRDRIIWLERILTIMEEELPRREVRKKDILRRALRDKRVPEGLIPHLKAFRDSILKRYKSRIAKEHGKKGGIKRAQKYLTSKTAAEDESNKIASSEETRSRAS